MDVDEWDEEFNARPVATTMLMIGIVIAIILMVIAVVWSVVTGFSYWWGQGNAQQEKNSAQNWTRAQVSFHQQVNDYDGYLKKIAQAKQALTDFDKLHPNLTGEDGLVGMQDTQARQSLTVNLAGVQQQCINVVSDYNTASEGYLTEDWKDADLPSRLDSNACG
jgi:hypothetical protein